MKQFQHYKENTYTLLNEAEHTETGEIFCVYTSNTNPNKVWVRPKTMFYETVEIEGTTVPRFKESG